MSEHGKIYSLYLSNRTNLTSPIQLNIVHTDHNTMYCCYMFNKLVSGRIQWNVIVVQMYVCFQLVHGEAFPS